MPIARFSSCAEAWREATEEDGEPHRLEVRHGTGLTDEGFDFSLLSEFRARLLQNGAEQRLFETFLTLLLPYDPALTHVQKSRCPPSRWSELSPARHRNRLSSRRATQNGIPAPAPGSAPMREMPSEVSDAIGFVLRNAALWVRATRKVCVPKAPHAVLPERRE